MLELPVIFSIIVASGTTVVAGISFASKFSLQKTNAKLSDKLLVLEARQADLISNNLKSNNSKTNSAKPTQTKAAENATQSSRNNQPQQPKSEVLDLRKDLAHSRDEIKKLKDDLRLRDSDLRDEKTQTENKLHALKEENKHLLEQLKANSQSSSTRTFAPAATATAAVAPVKTLDPEIQSLKNTIKEGKIQLENLDKKIMSQATLLRQADEKFARANADLKKWNEVETAFGGAALDPQLFVKWRDRAITGRRMYQLMKQLRELSDEKLLSYQQGVEALASHILKTHSIPEPQAQSGEVRADKLLAAAWTVTLGELPETPAPDSLS